MSTSTVDAQESFACPRQRLTHKGSLHVHASTVDVQWRVTCPRLFFIIIDTDNTCTSTIGIFSLKVPFGVSNSPFFAASKNNMKIALFEDKKLAGLVLKFHEAGFDFLAC